MPENDTLAKAGIHFSSDDEKILKVQIKKFINILINEVDGKFKIFQKLMSEKVFVVDKDGRDYTVANQIGRKIP